MKLNKLKKSKKKFPKIVVWKYIENYKINRKQILRLVDK